MKVSGKDAIELVNKLVAAENITDFQLFDFDGSRMRICGSFDLCYYHDIEVVFIDPVFTSLAMYFSEPTFRMANKEEIAELAHVPDKDESVFCVEADGRKYFVIAADIQAEKCKVYHYQRENLGKDERIETARTLNPEKREKD